MYVCVCVCVCVCVHVCKFVCVCVCLHLTFCPDEVTITGFNGQAAGLKTEGGRRDCVHVCSPALVMPMLNTGGPGQRHAAEIRVGWSGR